MAHGTPADPSEIGAFYTRIRRGRPPEPAQLAELEGRYARHRRRVPARRAHAGPGRRAARRTRGAARRDATSWLSGPSTPTRSIEDAADRALRRRGVERVVGLVLTPHALVDGIPGVPRPRRGRARGSTPFVPVGPWYAEPGIRGRSWPRGSRGAPHLARDGARCHVIFTAHSLPERIREAGDTYPDQLAESARLVAEAAGLGREDWSVAWQSAGRTPEPWLGPDVRDEVRRLATAGAGGRGRRVPDRVRGRPPRGALRPRRRAGRGGRGVSAWPTPARRR